jgi:hypothetical protein
MANGILIDEFHLSAFVPRGLPAAAEDAVRRTLDKRNFLANLRRVVRDVFSTLPILDQGASHRHAGTNLNR